MKCVVFMMGVSWMCVGSLYADPNANANANARGVKPVDCWQVCEGQFGDQCLGDAMMCDGQYKNCLKVCEGQ